jgi:hypothetical protein
VAGVSSTSAAVIDCPDTLLTSDPADVEIEVLNVALVP